MNMTTIGDGKNHNFGKLSVDGTLELAPAAIIVDGKQYIGNNETRYREAGYFPIVYTKKPDEITEGYHYEAGYILMPYSIDSTGATIYKIYEQWYKVSDLPANAIDTSVITDWSYYCYNGVRTETANKLNTSGGINFNRMFCNAANISTISLNCQKADTIQYAFYQCSELKYLTLQLPSIETAEEMRVSSIQSFGLANAFRYASKLEHLNITGNIHVMSDDLHFAYCPLTRDSLLSILSALSSDGNTHTVVLGSANIKKLTEEEIADAKDNKKILFE